MNTMVERVARIICRNNLKPTDHYASHQIEGIVELTWKSCIEPARAAIAAMREPDYELIQILKDKMIGHGGELTYPQWIKLWQSVIDVALGEK